MINRDQTRDCVIRFWMSHNNSRYNFENIANRKCAFILKDFLKKGVAGFLSFPQFRILGYDWWILSGFLLFKAEVQMICPRYGCIRLK